MLIATAILIPRISAQGEYTQKKEFSIPESDERTCYFGGSLAVNEKYIFIGSKSSTVDGVQSAGKVFVYDYNGNQQIIEPSNLLPNYKFGTTVFTGNKKIIISEIEFKEGKGPGLGAVYLYDLDLNLITKIDQPDVSETAMYGISSVILSDRIIITEPDANTELTPLSGRVHEYNHNGDLILTIPSPRHKPFAGYGHRVVADQDIIVVTELYGTFWDQNFLDGTIHVYDHSWNEIATLHPESHDIRNNLGYASAINDDYIFIGDRTAEVDGNDRAGIVYMYDKQGEFIKTIQSPTPVTGALFANCLAVHDNVLVIGAPDENSGKPYSGKMYVYNIENESFSELIPVEPVYQGRFGQNLAIYENNLIVNEPGTEKVYHYTTDVTHATDSQPEPESTKVLEPNPEEESTVIPGFPIYAIIIGLVLFSLFFYQRI